MPKPKRKLTAAEKRARHERKWKFMTILVNGKQKRVPRPSTIDGVPVEAPFFNRKKGPGPQCRPYLAARKRPLGDDASG